MKLFNCIAYLTIVSAVLIAAAIGYRSDRELFSLLGLLSIFAMGANVALVVMAAVRPSPKPAYDPED